MVLGVLEGREVKWWQNEGVGVDAKDAGGVIRLGRCGYAFGGKGAKSRKLEFPQSPGHDCTGHRRY